MAEMCKKHEDQKLKFYCRDCRLPLCSDCMLLAKHERHKADDLAEAADTARDNILRRKQEAMRRREEVQSKLEEAERNLRYYELTARHARRECGEMFKNFKKAIQEIETTTITNMRKLDADGRLKQEEHIHSLKKNKSALSDMIGRTKSALSTASNTEILEFQKQLEGEFYIQKESDTLVQKFPVYSMEVSFTDHFDRQQFVRDVRSHFSGPDLAQTGGDNPVSVVYTFRCSKSNYSTVNLLFPSGVNTMCVLYKETDETTKRNNKTERKAEKRNADESRRADYSFAMYDLESMKISENRVSLENKRYQVFDFSPSSVKLFPSVYTCGGKPVLITFDRPHSLLTSMAVMTKGCYSLSKPLMGGKYSVRRGTIDGGTEVFKISTDDPIDICVNTAEEYFAVMQMSPSNSVQSPSIISIPTGNMSFKRSLCVAVFKKPESTHTGLFRPRIPEFNPSAICFYMENGQEKLIVADKGTNAIYSVNFLEVGKDGLLREYEEIVSGCPWLVSPTAVTVDQRGSLWVGCTGGHISRCVPSTKRTVYEAPIVAASEDETADSSFDDDNEMFEGSKEEDEVTIYQDCSPAGSISAGTSSDTLLSKDGDGALPHFHSRTNTQDFAEDHSTETAPSISPAPLTREKNFDTPGDRLVKQAQEAFENKYTSQDTPDTTPTPSRPSRLRPPSVVPSPQDPPPGISGTMASPPVPHMPTSSPVAPSPQGPTPRIPDTFSSLTPPRPTSAPTPVVPLSPSPEAPSPHDPPPDILDTVSPLHRPPKGRPLPEAPNQQGPLPDIQDTVSPHPGLLRSVSSPASAVPPPVAPEPHGRPRNTSSAMSFQPRVPKPKPPPGLAKSKLKRNSPTTVAPKSKNTARDLKANSSDHMSELEKKLAERRKKDGTSD